MLQAIDSNMKEQPLNSFMYGLPFRTCDLFEQLADYESHSDSMWTLRNRFGKMMGSQSVRNQMYS